MPTPVAPGDPATLTAIVQDLRLAGDPLKPVMAAEYFVGQPGVDGSGTALVPTDGTWGDTVEDVEGEIDTSGLVPGTYYVLVHGMNVDGQWGPFSAAWLNVEDTAQPFVYVGDIRMRYRVVGEGIYRVQARVPILDQDVQPIEGATVTAEWTTPSGRTRVQSIPTRANGFVFFGITLSEEGIYTLNIQDVQADGYIYAPDQNIETSEQLTVP